MTKYEPTDECLDPAEDINFPHRAVEIIKQVLKDNEHKYPPGHWRTVAIDEHVHHALRHLCQYLSYNRDEPHLEHALTRLAFAVELEQK